MEDQTPLGSQEIPPSSRATSTSGENLGSSPLLPTLSKQHGSKPRKAPTITPRSFTRFFTPKSSLERGGRIGASRQALRDITASASNRKGRRTPTKDTIKIFQADGEGTGGGSKRRKRKIPDSQDVTPDRSSPLKRIRNQSLDISEDEASDTGTVESRDDAKDPFRRSGRQPKFIERIVGSNYRSSQGQYLRREIGINNRESEFRCLAHNDGISREWQWETTNFLTGPEDAYVCMNVGVPSEHTIPFCTASCNSEFQLTVICILPHALTWVLQPILLLPLEMRMEV